MPHKQFLQVQMGKESTWGTPVAPTVKLMGVDPNGVQMSPGYQAAVINVISGSYQPGNVAYMNQAGGGTLVIPTVGLYDDAPYHFDALLGEATPSGGGPYTYSYTGPSSSIARREQTAVYGDGTDAYGLAGALCQQLVLTQAIGSPLQLNATYIGKQWLDDAVAALSDRSVNVIQADHWAVYLDAWGGTIGSTALASCTAVGFVLTLNNPPILERGLGDIVPCGYTDQPFMSDQNTLQLTLKFPGDSNEARDILDSMVAATPSVIQKQIRLKASNGASLDMQLDFAGSLIAPPTVFTDVDGITTLQFGFNATYNSTLGNWFAADIVNGVSALA